MIEFSSASGELRSLFCTGCKLIMMLIRAKMFEVSFCIVVQLDSYLLVQNEA